MSGDPRLERREPAAEMLPPNEWWDDLAEETQAEIQRLAMVAFKAEISTAFWRSLSDAEKIRLMTGARDAAVDRANKERRRARQLAEAVERFARAQGGDDKHEWESAHDHLLSLAAEILEGSPAA